MRRCVFLHTQYLHRPRGFGITMSARQLIIIFDAHAHNFESYYTNHQEIIIIIIATYIKKQLVTIHCRSWQCVVAT